MRRVFIRERGYKEVGNMITKLAWLAGILDGEGCLGVYNNKQKGRKYYATRPHIVIVNTDTILIDEAVMILNALGVKYYLALRKRANPKWKRSFTLAVQSKKGAIKLLEAVMPHLIAKREQAEIVLQYCRGEGNKILLCERIKELNRKGIKND